MEEGERMQQQINANQFIDCSAKNNKNIDQVIYEAIRAAVDGQSSKIEFFKLMKWILCC